MPIMWWLEFLSVALFAMGWWPCQGCVSGPGTNNGCVSYCSTNTTPLEITVVISAGAVGSGGCSSGQCDTAAGTYIIPSVGGACFPLATFTSSAMMNIIQTCTLGNLQIEVGWTGIPDTDFEIKAIIDKTGGNGTAIWKNIGVATFPTKMDCAGYIATATSVSFLSSSVGGCDFSAVTATAQHT